jgi:hypothetical protein
MTDVPADPPQAGRHGHGGNAAPMSVATAAAKKAALDFSGRAQTPQTYEQLLLRETPTTHWHKDTFGA